MLWLHAQTISGRDSQKAQACFCFVILLLEFYCELFLTMKNAWLEA